ncbi:MAG: glycosyltransferase [Candidatus Fermentibacteraceae bacterium]
MNSTVSVVIPSRNGLEFLKKQLPVLIEDNRLEVLVVDDCSSDGSTEALRKAFPSLRVLTRNGNPGFCYAVNEGMEAASSDLLLLLNNDVTPEPGCFEGMALWLSDAPSSVAVAVPKIMRPDGTDDGSMEWGFHRGLAFTAPGAGNPYPSGACALWRRDAWFALGGLSTRYAPIYWEDADLGARMTRSGMVMARYDGPGVLHDHAATMGKSIDSETLRERNRFLFMESWCSSAGMRARTWVWLPVHLALAKLKGNKAFTNGYAQYVRHRNGH